MVFNPHITLPLSIKTLVGQDLEVLGDQSLLRSMLDRDGKALIRNAATGELLELQYFGVQLVALTQEELAAKQTAERKCFEHAFSEHARMRNILARAPAAPSFTEYAQRRMKELEAAYPGQLGAN